MVKSTWPLGLGVAIMVAGLIGLWLPQSPQQILDLNPPGSRGWRLRATASAGSIKQFQA